MDDSVGSVGIPDSGGGNVDRATIVERIKWCVERVSLDFDRWNDPHARGPGLYFVVERDSSTAFVEPMGTNRWPIEDCASIFGSSDALVETAKIVASACDGAVIVHADGTIEEEMVRLKQLSTEGDEQNDELPYAGWMGARHMSALETSTRKEVLRVITLSEEDGRVTIFTDGKFEDYPHDELSER